jgi:crotonobetainyl-CoA:carnitine CoA-transferase CaiB-like acyl-CoA transferase
VYDIFDTQDGRVFVAVVSDANWQTFCRDFLPPSLR